MLSGELDYISRDVAEAVIDKIPEVERMLKALIKSLEGKPLSKIYPP